MENKPRLVQTFVATDPSGREYELAVYEDAPTAMRTFGPAHPVPGKRDIVTADGLPVNRLAKGEYELPGDFGMIRLTSNDPDAP